MWQEVLTIRNDIADPSCICLRQTTSCTCSVSTQQHGRSVHTIICQGNAALFCQGIVLFRANSCQGFETTSAESIFTYINIAHKTRNSNLHPRTSWQTTSQYYFPVYTTRYYTACTQYYFALQSLQKLLPSTTLYHKTCTKYSPVLLGTTKLAQSPSQYTTICSFKTRRHSRKKTIFKHFEKGFLQ